MPKKPKKVSPSVRVPPHFAATQEDAYRRALALAKKLGPSWSIDVWHNVGWAYKVRSACRRIEVYPSVYCSDRGMTYAAFLFDEDDVHTKYVGRGMTPRSAIAEAARKVQDDVRRLTALVENVNPLTGETR